MSFLTARDVEKDFGNITALNGISLKAEEGEIIGVLGPNGAGKSTLVKVLTGQIDRDSGIVEVLGLDPEDNGLELKEKIGVLPEREDPPSFLTGDEYLEMVTDIRGEEIDRDEWIKKMDLNGLMDTLTRNLSKGERQKLMVIQAFFHQPELVFVDEPMINLDPLVQERVKEIFREHREREGTVFLCTHVISLAEELCDRVLFLKEGEVIEEVENVENLKQRFLDEE